MIEMIVTATFVVNSQMPKLPSGHWKACVKSNNSDTSVAAWPSAKLALLHACPLCTSDVPDMLRSGSDNWGPRQSSQLPLPPLLPWLKNSLSCSKSCVNWSCTMFSQISASLMKLSWKPKYSRALPHCAKLVESVMLGDACRYRTYGFFSSMSAFSSILSCTHCCNLLQSSGLGQNVPPCTLHASSFNPPKNGPGSQMDGSAQSYGVPQIESGFSYGALRQHLPGKFFFFLASVVVNASFTPQTKPTEDCSPNTNSNPLSNSSK
mmetsp:Transcript_25934/g.72353  ORF Transcript_25934/g.72353 Transcript_25934/m.72353 type:complete len:264 (-) Transcript_25934:183-974(-)